MVLSPDNFELFLLAGIIAANAAELPLAQTAYRRSLTLKESVAALVNLAQILSQQGEHRIATRVATRALSLDPASTASAIVAGRVSLASGEIQSAYRFATNCLLVEPTSTDARSLRAAALYRDERFEPALLDYRIILNKNPVDAETLNNIATCLFKLGQPRVAGAFFLKAVVASPGDVKTNLRAGCHFLRLGQWSSATTFITRANSIDSQHEKTRWNLGLIQLGFADFKAGWLLHESRFGAEQVDRLPDLRDFSPATAGGRVLVWAEQGVGDEIMFGSMLGDFHRRVGRLLVQMDRRLIPLFRRSLPGDIEFVERGEKVAESRYESHLAMGSLGLYERPTLESFGGKGGRYLRAEGARVERIRSLMGLGAAERAVGISWRSSNPETGSMRSVGLKELVVALRGRGVRLVNLQYGEVREEIEGVYEALGERVWECGEVDNREDLDGLAALIEACDEVVSIGNATAHLAGALGKRTTVLLPEAPSWRWLAQGTTTPWYESLALRRLPTGRTWSDYLLSELFRD